jgi:hypothetical protein
MSIAAEKRFKTGRGIFAISSCLSCRRFACVSYADGPLRRRSVVLRQQRNMRKITNFPQIVYYFTFKINKSKFSGIRKKTPAPGLKGAQADGAALFTIHTSNPVPQGIRRTG